MKCNPILPTANFIISQTKPILLHFSAALIHLAQNAIDFYIHRIKLINNETYSHNGKMNSAVTYRTSRLKL